MTKSQWLISSKSGRTLLAAIVTLSILAVASIAIRPGLGRWISPIGSADCLTSDGKDENMSAALYAVADWFFNALKNAKNQGRIPVLNRPPTGWGQSIVLKANADPNQDGKGLVCDFSSQMQTHTIQFDGFDNNLNAGINSLVITEAEVIWGVNGIPVRRVINVLDGTSISAPAQGVTVNLRDRSVNGNGTEYRIGVTVTQGVRANIQQPPTLRIDGSTAAGAFSYNGVLTASGGAADTATWTVPPNVGAISSFITAVDTDAVPAALTDVSVLVSNRNSTAQTLKRYGFSGCNLWMPLAPGTRTITLVNRTAQGMQVSCVLGIEG